MSKVLRKTTKKEPERARSTHLRVEPMNKILDIAPPVNINDNPWMPKGCAKMLMIAQSTGGKDNTYSQHCCERLVEV